MYFGKGERKNVLHNTLPNIQFRQSCLEKRMENLTDEKPARTEVFLDESYCHLHHSQGLTWVKHGRAEGEGEGQWSWYSGP